MVDPPVKHCPTLRPIPYPGCGIVCARRQAQNDNNNRNNDKKRDVEAAVGGTTTIPRAIVVTVATVTATVPGRNPACPETATVTVISSAAADAAATPQLVCPLGHLQRCACTNNDDGPGATVEVVYTAFKTATAYTTEAPQTCLPLPTGPPVVAKAIAVDAVEERAEASEPRSFITATTAQAATTGTTAGLAPSSTCASYTTRVDSRYCLHDRRHLPTLAAPSVGGPATAVAEQKRSDSGVTVTRGCTVYINPKPMCPTRGV